MNNLDLYAEYIKEREGKEILSFSNGFAVYKINNNALFVKDIFVIEAERRKGLMTKMAKELENLARQENCSMLLGQVDLQSKGATEALLAQMSYGMVPVSANSDIITLRKVLNG